MQKKLEVPFLSTVNYNSNMDVISKSLDDLKPNTIAEVPWKDYSYKPDVHFMIAHGQDNILLKYIIIENDIRAVYLNPNDPVYKDSCVELFISFNNEKEYYNIECNFIGTCLIAFGPNRGKRKFLPASVIKKIKSSSSILNIENRIYWEIVCNIPLSIFYFHQFNSLKGISCKANFYKCGDDLPIPHYITWNRIDSENPDFHRPEYFGQLSFL